jgi:hypothetical protein
VGETHTGRFQRGDAGWGGWRCAVAGVCGGRRLRAPFVFRLNQAEESNPHRKWGVRPCGPQIWSRIEPGAVAGAAPCRCLQGRSCK